MKADIILSHQAAELIKGANTDVRKEYIRYTRAPEEERPEPSEELRACLSLEECDIILRYNDFSPEELTALILPNIRQISGELALEMVALIPEEGTKISESSRDELEQRCVEHTTITSGSGTAMILFGILNKEQQDLYRDTVFVDMVSAAHS